MILDIAVNMFFFGALCIVYGDKVFILIAQFEIGFIENLIFLNVCKHL